MKKPRTTKKVSDKEITEQHIEKLNEDHSKELEAARKELAAIKELLNKTEELSKLEIENLTKTHNDQIAHLESLLDDSVSRSYHKEQIDKQTEAYLRLQDANRELDRTNSELRVEVDRLKVKVTAAEALYATAKTERDKHVELWLEADEKVQNYRMAFFLTASIVVAETLHIIFR